MLKKLRMLWKRIKQFFRRDSEWEQRVIEVSIIENGWEKKYLGTYANAPQWAKDKCREMERELSAEIKRIDDMIRGNHT